MNKAMRWILLLLLVVCGSRVSMGQNTSSGDIRGTVTDSTGAVVPGVTVTLRDVEKDVIRTYVTNSAGLYDTGAIGLDHYLLTFTKEGFQSYVRGPVTVTVGNQTVNAILAVGAITQQVVVNTDVPMLQTESGAQEGSIEADALLELPQTSGQNGGGADWQNFIILMAGSSGAPENSSNGVAPNAGQASVNGSLPYASVLQDGATTTLPMSQNSDVTVFETTAEVKLSATAFSAQYGIGNMVYNQITKSGGDRFHGAAYEYFQNNMFNAASYQFGSGKGVGVLRFNNFGGSIGGPIMRHKMFFYLNYDRTINHGGASTGFSTEPTAAMMLGDFSGPGFPTLYDPTTQVVNPNGGCVYTDGAPTAKTGVPCVIRKSFIQETGVNKIPTTMLNPVALAFQKYFPTPNIQGQDSGKGYNQNNYAYQVPSSNPFIKWFGRLDYDVTPKNRLTLSDTDSDNPSVGLGEGICPINCQSQDVSRDNAQISDVWTINDHLINEARLGFTDQLNFYVPYSEGKGYPAKLGLKFAVADIMPQLSVSGFDTNITQGTAAVYKEFVYDPSDVVTMIKGRHVLHFGGEFLVNQANSTAWGNMTAGHITYAGTYTSQGGSNTSTYDGLSYADFLLGATQQWSANNTPEYGGRMKVPQAFVQDDWKFKNNLTINLGVRYQINTGWSDVKGNMSTFDPAVSNFNVSQNPINGIAAGAPVQGGMWYGFSGANGRTTLQAPKYNIWMPRLGFSWQPKNDTVIRGGFGVYTALWSEDTYGGGLGGAFGANNSLNDNSTTNGICPVVNLSADMNTPNTQMPGCGVSVGGFDYNSKTIGQANVNAPTTPWAKNGANVSFNQYHTPVPTNYEYSLSVQRQFAKDYVAQVAYVGNKGRHLNTSSLDINQPKTPGVRSSSPYPIFGNVTGSTNNAISNYNSLQATLSKSVSHGLMFSTNYTWSHFLSDMDSSGWGSRGGWQDYQDGNNIHNNYSNSNFDIRHMLKGQVVYQLPFGKGKDFLNKSQLVDEILGGWSVSGTYVVQGGNPISVTTGGNNTSGNLSGSSKQFANIVGDYTKPWQSYNLKTKTYSGATYAYHSLNSWFNDNVEAAGDSVGSQPWMNPSDYTNQFGTFRRNKIYGPGLSSINFSMGKAFDIVPDRGIKFQIRAEATNLPNHASFGQPGNNAIGTNAPEQITSTTVGGRKLQFVGRLSF